MTVNRFPSTVRKVEKPRISSVQICRVLRASARRIKVASASGERELDVEQLYRIPGAENEREVTLAPNEILTHIFIPPVNRARNATYEVRKRQGLDWP